MNDYIEFKKKLYALKQFVSSSTRAVLFTQKYSQIRTLIIFIRFDFVNSNFVFQKNF